MFKNYLKTSFRYLVKNKAYAAINILGLAVGLACFLLLTIFVKNEFSYDEFHSKKEVTYQVFLKDTAQSTTSEYRIQTQAPMAELLDQSLPEIVNTSRFYKEVDKVIKVGSSRFLIDQIHFADPSVFEMFDFPLSAGIGRKPELGLNEIVISEMEAIKLYGHPDLAIGRELEIVEMGKFVVKDVFNNLPENTHFDFDYILNFDGAQEKIFKNWASGRTIEEWGFLSAFPLYVETVEGLEDIAELEMKIEEVILPHSPSKIKLVPLADIYFSELGRFPFGKRGNKAYAQLYLIIAMVILAVALVNYMNMATARQAKRSKEVGIRKTIGGSQNQIIRQFLTESMIIAFVSMVLGVCLAEMFVPTLSEFIEKPFQIDYSNPMTIILLLGGTLLTGFVSGAYPAFYLSRFNPVRILTSQRSENHKKLSFRHILVAFQFIVCLGLMTVTGIVSTQFSYMKNLDKGLDDKQVISVPLKDQGFRGSYHAFKSELLNEPSIQSVSGAEFSVFTLSGSYFVEPEGGGESVSVSFMSVENNFLDEMGIQVSEGAGFDLNNDSVDEKKILINKSAQEAMGWDDPLGKKLKGFNYSVIGVTPDFIYGSAKEAVAPLMILNKEDGFKHAYIKISSNNTKEAIEHIRLTFEKFAQSYPFDYSFLDEDFARKYDKEQKLSRVFSTFSALAIFVAGLGILGLSIYIAERRIKEIGIRKVLGANMLNIVWLLNRGTTILIVLVSLITLPSIHAIMQSWLKDFNSRIQLGLELYLLPLSVLILTIWLILLSQSIKSARQNPVNALRTE